MKRDAVDFTLIPDHQAAIHERLINWARAQRNGSGGDCSPMFRQYRSTEVWAETHASIPVNQGDATRINAAWKMLPTQHRLALAWYYITPTMGVKKACQGIGCKPAVLMVYAIDGRQMLINRRV